MCNANTEQTVWSSRIKRLTASCFLKPFSRHEMIFCHPSNTHAHTHVCQAPVQTGSVNEQSLCVTVWFAPPCPSIRLSLSSHPWHGWPAWACPQCTLMSFVTRSCRGLYGGKVTELQCLDSLWIPFVELLSGLILITWSITILKFHKWDKAWMWKCPYRCVHICVGSVIELLTDSLVFVFFLLTLIKSPKRMSASIAPREWVSLSKTTQWFFTTVFRYNLGLFIFDCNYISYI